MTDLRKAAEMALDYINDIRDHCAVEGIDCDKEDDLIEVLRQALAQTEQDAVNQSDCGHKEYKPLCQMCVSKKQPEQEPVAWMSIVKKDSAFDKFRFAQSDMYPTPLHRPTTQAMGRADG